MQQQPDALPHTTKLFQPAAKMAQPTVANVGNSSNLFVSKVAPVTLKEAAPKHVQFGNMLPPNQTTTNNKMRNDTLPPHVAPPLASLRPHIVISEPQERKHLSTSQSAETEVSRIFR